MKPNHPWKVEGTGAFGHEGHSGPRREAPAGRWQVETRPEVIRQLEELDDVIFGAINGDARALDHAASCWKQALARLGPEAVAESRRQYARYACSVLRSREEPQHRVLPRQFAALEILALVECDPQADALPKGEATEVASEWNADQRRFDGFSQIER